MSETGFAGHFFRHEYGRLVATLARKVGGQHLDAVEDAVQVALLAALDSWRVAGRPDQPSAWLYRVAHNTLLGELRQVSRRHRLLGVADGEPGGSHGDAPDVLLPNEIQDDLLRMLFACCDESIPVESQLVLALKTLCGFDVREIAVRLFCSEANVYKRLERARGRLRERPSTFNDLTVEQYAARLPSVHGILYLLFTEGHLSASSGAAIRQELTDEAIRLGGILARHPVGQGPETSALLALMNLHAARINARQDAAGGLILLEDQDRSLWDQEKVRVGLSWLADSARGEVFSRYHAEAGIAAEHCLAPSFDETRWDRIAERYALLEQVAPSALHRLNRAVAVAQWQGAPAGLAVLEGFVPPTWLAGSYQWSAVLADLHRRAGAAGEAARYQEVAIQTAPSDAVRDLLRRRAVSGFP